LSVAGNCRMCLIEIKNAPKPIISCSINARSILNNGVVFTKSPLVKKARENILEFLLLNHPLDCPICDQGGECDLQDQSLFFGFSNKRFYGLKRIVTDKNIGPVVKTVMTRCIHCTRCVRFATEIAGVEDLGVFGRGVNSEIGTYVEKVFQSELSGNIIDLCPVGALTSKPYPFVGRNWELKRVKTIDYADGFGTEIQCYIKNNKIVKITTILTKISSKTIWISDKIRFSFDGLFSSERLLNKIIIKCNKQSYVNKIAWKHLIKHLLRVLYFKDHFNNQNKFKNKIILIFNNNVDLETLNLLNLVNNKFYSIQIRKIENINLKNDLTTSISLTKNLNSLNLNKFNLCLLLGTNIRYEGYSLNLKLRQRYLKGNFKLFTIGSLINMTYPCLYLGLNFSIIKFLTEGNHPFCKNLCNQSSIIIANYELFNKMRKFNINILEQLIKYTKIFNLKTNLNIIHNSLNSFGVKYLDNFKTLSNQDLKYFNGVYLLNIESQQLKNLLELKLLNYFNEQNKTQNFIIEHNYGFETTTFKSFKTLYNIYNYSNIPNKIFFEKTKTYLNTEGYFKQSIKIIHQGGKQRTKDDWAILRRFFAYFKKIKFTNEFNNKLSYKPEMLNFFQNYTTFQFYPTTRVDSFYNIFFSLNNNTTKKIFNKFNFIEKSVKIYFTNIKTWLDDFFIKNKDFFSKYSKTMILCSKSFRKETTNFLKINIK